MSFSPPRVVVVPGAPVFVPRARQVARDLGLALVGAPAEGELALVLDEAGWGLLDPSPDAPGPVRCDLLGGTFGDRLRRGIGPGERLAKAMGLRAHPSPTVLDATAGLGRDSVIAAALGCEVIACERSPIVGLLLFDGLERAAAGGLETIVSRIALLVVDARDVMAALGEADRPDVVVIDPMFPKRGKSAKAKKEMQVLHRLLGPEPDVAPLLAAALASARRRVVVKRPAHEPPVAGRAPSLVVPGKSARYDVYVTG